MMTEEAKRIAKSIARYKHHEAWKQYQESEPPKWRVFSHLRWAVSFPRVPEVLKDELG